MGMPAKNNISSVMRAMYVKNAIVLVLSILVYAFFAWWVPYYVKNASVCTLILMLIVVGNTCINCLLEVKEGAEYNVKAICAWVGGYPNVCPHCENARQSNMIFSLLFRKYTTKYECGTTVTVKYKFKKVVDWNIEGYRSSVSNIKISQVCGSMRAEDDTI